jgi:preprotein translocase SecE subunit
VPYGAFFITIKIIMKPIQFLKETYAEMKQVSWPTGRKALVYTIVILLLSVGIGYMLSGFDAGFRELIRMFVLK